jgi:AcrR family transcriptional regulator
MPRVFRNFKEEYKEEARKRILDAALVVAKRKGYQSMTLDDVADEVGVTKGTLYLYFKNKEDLFRNIFCGMSKSFEETMEYTHVDTDDLDTALRSVIDHIITFSKAFGIENNLALIGDWVSVAIRDASGHSLFREMFMVKMQHLEDRFRVLQEKKQIPATVDIHAATRGIFGLTAVVKLMIFFGDDEDEIRAWWIGSVKKLLDVPATPAMGK